MSYETTIARHADRAAQAAWKDHRQHCPPCDRWASRQAGQQGCAKGQELREDARATAAELRESRRLDREPGGMEALF